MIWGMGCEPEVRRKGGGNAHNAIDGHDFTEDDAGMRVVSELAFFLECRATDLMRFLVRIRGARTPPPRIDEPVTKIPLRLGSINEQNAQWIARTKFSHHPAPRTLSPIQRPIPVDAHMYGLDSSRNRPTLNASPEPVRQLRFFFSNRESDCSYR